MTKQPNAVRTRIAPSPTGFPHIGTIYQVLFDYVFAKQHKGAFVCRIEDTDRARFVEGSEDVIYQSFDWFDLNPDESPKVGGPFAPYRQSERLDIYKKYADELVQKKHAYYCFCSKERLETIRAEQAKKKIPPMYDKHCLTLSAEVVQQKLKDKTPHVIRMKIPANRKITFTDSIVGEIEFDSSAIDDQVLIKSDGFPTYHLAVVVDDHLMEISHVLRGREWISSTPKHVLLYEFFGWEMPIHGHLPLLLNGDGKGKLSKRHGHASVDFYKQEGFLPEAILNFLSNSVWAHPEGKEIYSREELIQLIDITKINSQGARFDLIKLEWMNGEYIRLLSPEVLQKKIIDFVHGRHPKRKSISEEIVAKTIPLIQTRIKKLSEYWPMCDFFFKRPSGYELPINKEWIRKAAERVATIPTWKHEPMYREFAEVAQSFGSSKSKFFMDIRIAITGKQVGPPLFESMQILGKEESIQRLQKAIS